jgi:hypothetical protein
VADPGSADLRVDEAAITAVAERLRQLGERVAVLPVARRWGEVGAALPGSRCAQAAEQVGPQCARVLSDLGDAVDGAADLLRAGVVALLEVDRRLAGGTRG